MVQCQMTFGQETTEKPQRVILFLEKYSVRCSSEVMRNERYHDYGLVARNILLACVKNTKGAKLSH